MNSRLLSTCLVAGALVAAPARATYLFSSANFPIPEFANDLSALVEYSEWNVLYAPHTVGNYPDVGAPHGGVFDGTEWKPVQRSTAGFPANDPIYNPDNPYAFWDTRNATITQSATSAFIIGPDTSGNIYSWQGKTSYVLKDSTADAVDSNGNLRPFNLGTVMFQFQTDGTLVDFSSIKLRYKDANNVTHELSATEYLREFLGTSSADPSAANAFTNRVSLQWDLTGLNINTYEIVWESKSSSMSFQKAVLDTSDTYGVGVPASRTWTATNGNWSAGSSWQQGSTSVANGNVKFANTAAATVNLNANPTIGEMIFQSANNVTINRSGSQKIVSNTGISTTAAATGTYVINAAWELGATNIFEINAGDVRLNGPITGGYGILKQGDGKLTIGGTASFSGGITLWGGTMRLEGANTYSGGTAIITGRMEVASESPRGAAGALGTSTNAISLGADADNFAVVGGGPAALFIDGNRTVGQDVNLAAGGFEKRLGALNAGGGATYAGAIAFSAGGFGGSGQSASNVYLTATAAGDRLNFTGAMTGGKTTDTLTVDGAGTVVLGGGTAKSFGSKTTVSAGTLEVAGGTTFDGAGDWTISSGAKLRVNGSFAGAGALAVNGTLTGSGTVTKSVNLAGGRVAPGVNVGSLTMVGAQTWSGGGGYEWQIGSANGAAGTGFDFLQITGALNVAATAGNRFTIYVSSVGIDGLGALLADFDPSQTDQWLLVTASGGITGFAASDFLIDATAFLNAPDGKFSVSLQGNSLFLNYAPVPEPGTWALLILGAGALLFARRLAGNR